MADQNHDIIEDLKNRKETLWLNSDLIQVEPAFKLEGFGYIHVRAAQNRFMRYLPFVAKTFPETAEKKGVIESPLIPIPKMQAWFEKEGLPMKGRLFLKDDARLPVAGSVKARGGIHEVMKLAEVLAQRAGLLMPGESYEKLASPEMKEFFGQYTIQAGSTGNLGISIGRTAARFGFRTIIHMSSDAKQWKKDLLRSEGVTVVEYDGDYSSAVAAGRKASKADEKSFFVDDENSEELFFGYSTAAVRLAVQFSKANILVDKDHPLFVYLPCGVGGAPGGITFGLKQKFGNNVHCFFAEPLEQPCMTLAMASGKQDQISTSDIGLGGRTIADGLAVGRASGFTCRMMEPLMSGAYTLSDEQMEVYRKALWQTEGIRLEPSACAGFLGAAMMGSCSDGVESNQASAWRAYLEDHDLLDKMDNATHIAWGTGGGLVPESQWED